MAIITKLATRDDLKQRLGTSETAQDALFDELLEDATQAAVDLVGVEIRREVDVAIYPWDPDTHSAFLYLPRFPVESITSVKQAYAVPSGNDWSGITALTEHSDYFIVDPGAGQATNRGTLRRINSQWQRGQHLIQVVGTFGFADPGSIPVGGIAPPKNLQEGIIAEALKRWSYRRPGGLGQKENGADREDAPHDKLVRAAEALRRRWV